jgi:hypothetical protein
VRLFPVGLMALAACRAGITPPRPAAAELRPTAVAPPAITAKIVLKHALAERLAEMLRTVLADPKVAPPGRGNCVFYVDFPPDPPPWSTRVDPASRSLIVTGMPEKVARVRELAAKLDDHWDQIVGEPHRSAVAPSPRAALLLGYHDDAGL